MNRVKPAGVDLNYIHPEVIVSATGLALAGLLVANIPILGIIGAPVIAGLLLIIYKIGIEAFCQWSKEKDLRKADSENY